MKKPTFIGRIIPFYMSKKAAFVSLLISVLTHLKSKSGKYIAPVTIVVGVLSGIASISGINVVEALGYFGLSEDYESNTVTVLVHGVDGKEHLVLPGRGEVKLIYGDAVVAEQINNEGEATFKQIPDQFFQSHAEVEVIFEDPLGEPYHSVYPNKVYELKRGHYISLPVELMGLGRIYGIVKDFETGDLLSGVRVSVQGEADSTNRFGEYEIEIPPEKQQQFQTIHAFKEGYRTFHLNDVPLQTGNEVPILLKPKAE